jgi:ankyrin repeat protein
MLINVEECMSQEFFAAIHNNDRALVEQSLAADPALARARNQNGASALMQARYEGRHELVELLRSKAGQLDVFEAATLGDLPRLRALLLGNPALAKAFSNDGFTALHLAAFFAQPEAADELLRAGADPNAMATNPMKVAVIHSAAASGRADLVKLVLKAGADPNARQMMGYTALHAAAAHDNVEMVQALLDAGADSSLVNDEGKSPAEKAGPAVEELLKSRV